MSKKVNWDLMYEVYENDPISFCEDILSFSPDDWQKKVMKDIVYHPKVAIRSGQGVGKTALEACIVIWFLVFRPFSRVVATAPTRQQLYDVLWSEIAKWISGTILEDTLEWTNTKVIVKIKKGKKTKKQKLWFATAKTATKPENMQGFHEDCMLFIVDEASGVKDDIMEAILGTLSGVENKLLLCGNPTKSSGYFYDAFHQDRDIYKTHKVSSLDSSRTNKENIESLIKKFGKDSNVVRVRVYGEFPTHEDGVFISIELIESSIHRTKIEYNQYSIREYIKSFFEEIKDIDINNISIGVDVARFGGDKTVIVPKINEFIYKGIIKQGQDLMATSGDVIYLINALREFKKDYTGIINVIIDDTGLGGGVTDKIREEKKLKDMKFLNIKPVNFAQSVKHKFYSDIVTFLYANLRNDMSEGLVKLPDDNSLVGQLSVRRYDMISNGKIKLESKKQMKERGLPSPDESDATVLANCPLKLLMPDGSRKESERR